MSADQVSCPRSCFRQQTCCWGDASAAAPTGSQADNEPMADIAELHQRATGVPISKILPCERDYIVLLDYYHASQARLWANLRRLRSNGEVVWSASAPSSSDMFTDMEWRDGRLFVWTWEGFMITVDPETGRFLEKGFTK